MMTTFSFTRSHFNAISQIPLHVHSYWLRSTSESVSTVEQFGQSWWVPKWNDTSAMWKQLDEIFENGWIDFRRERNWVVIHVGSPVLSSFHSIFRNVVSSNYTDVPVMHTYIIAVHSCCVSRIPHPIPGPHCCSSRSTTSDSVDLLSIFPHPARFTIIY